MSDEIRSLARSLGISPEEVEYQLRHPARGWCPKREDVVTTTNCLCCADYDPLGRESSGCLFLAREERKQELKEMIDYLVGRLRE